MNTFFHAENIPMLPIVRRKGKGLEVGSGHHTKAALAVASNRNEKVRKTFTEEVAETGIALILGGLLVSLGLTALISFGGLDAGAFGAAVMAQGFSMIATAGGIGALFAAMMSGDLPHDWPKNSKEKKRKAKIGF